MTEIEAERKLARCGPNRVLALHQEARKTKAGVSGFYVVCDPVYRVFRAEFGRCRTAIERLAICEKFIKQFEELRDLPPERRSVLAYQATQQERTVSSAPAPFSVQEFLARINQAGANLALEGGQLTIRGRVHAQVRDQIAHHKDQIILYLKSPGEVI